MPTNTYVALATQTLGTATASVTFSSIPQGYTDLVLVIGSLGMNATGSAGKLRFNGDTASNYSNTILYGTGSSAGSYRESNQTNIRIYGAAVGPVANGNNDNVILHIQNYSNTTTNKTVLIRNNIPASETVAGVGLWRSTAAITSINIASYNGTDLFTAGSTFSLYGVAAASVGAKATGGAIYQDATYFYHVFSGNGTFTPSQSISADVLVVAGGGGGGGGGSTWASEGGGGAGGLLAFASQALTATNYTITVGAGGTAGVGYSTNGGNGGNSQFGALTTCIGGGGGGSYAGGNAASGGSGAGGNGYTTGSSSGAAGTSGQGFAGGNGNNASNNTGNGGGGGGAGAAGSACSGTSGGNGGIGFTSSLTNTIGAATGVGQLVSGAYYFAGGGGGGGGVTGGSAGPGGAGTGGSGNSNGTAALAYTGGGGGGCGGGGSGGATSGGNGGSGVIIVRYAK